MRRALGLEELEERIAPTVVAAGETLPFTDALGQSITVAYDGPDGSSVSVLDMTGGDIENGDDIGYIYFTGADLSSSLFVFGAQPDDTVVVGHLISAGGSQDVGLMAVGFNPDGDPGGVASLGENFAVDVGGTIGIFGANGNFDCDLAGQSVNAGGNIGLIAVNDLTLDSAIGRAQFVAGGAGGGGDISFITCENLFGSTGGAAVAPLAIPARGAMIADDAGAGASGFVNLKLSGGAPAGTYLAIPVVGGGSVLSDVHVLSAGTALSVTALAAGGDVSFVDFDHSTPGVVITGAADTDVLNVSGAGVIAQVTNKTFGGDIGAVTSLEDIGLIRTGARGVLGMISTGPGNSQPAAAGLEYFGLSTYAFGYIDAIKAGGIAYTTVDAAAIGTVTLGGTGVLGSDVIGQYGILSISSKGAIDNSGIFAVVDSGGTPSGGSIGSLAAPYLTDSTVMALGFIGKLTITKYMSYSSVSTYIDDGLGGHVGGPILAVSAGGLGAEASIVSNETILSARIGAGGMDGSQLLSYGDIVSVQVGGDVSAGTIQADGLISSMGVRGDIARGSMVQAGSIGSANLGGALSKSAIQADSAGTIRIGGGIHGDSALVSVSGDVTSLIVNGGIFGTANDSVTVGGAAGLVSVRGTVYDANPVFGSVATLKVSKSMVDSDVLASTAIGTVAVGGGMYNSFIESAGDIGLVAAKGILTRGAIEAGGSIGAVSAAMSLENDITAAVDLGPVRFTSGDVDFYSEITAGGDFAGMKVAGVIAGEITVAGNLTGSILSAGTNAVPYGGVYYFADSNGQLTGGVLSVGGAISPGVVIS